MNNVCNGTVVKEKEMPNTENENLINKYTATLVAVAAKKAVTIDGA